MAQGYTNGKRNVTDCATCDEKADACTLFYAKSGIFPAVGLCEDHLENNLRARQENASAVLDALREFTSVHATVYEAK